MIRDIQRLQNTNYDLLIVGGGINGAGLANIASAQGHKVALIEKADFASGTSSRSTKLIHGGFRYLENLQFNLVKEALKERHILLKTAPHLVKQLPFIVPVYKYDPRPLWKFKIGAWLYDYLSGEYKIGEHRNLSADEVLQLEPRLDRNSLQGGILFSDAQMDDARLCIENVMMADLNGAHVANYVKALYFIKDRDRVVGVEAHDEIRGEKLTIRAKKIVCAAGVWTDYLLKSERQKDSKQLRMTKGVHIVYKDKLTEHAVLLQAEDNRIFFIIPWREQTLIGTTDTDYTGEPEQVHSDKEDVDYLFKHVQKVFPSLDLKKENIAGTFAGLRPLVFEEGHASAVSRKHEIQKTRSGIFYIIGGKYTTFRKVAVDCLDKIGLLKGEPRFTVFGSGKIMDSAFAKSKEYDVETEVVEMLMAKYGTHYADVLNLIHSDIRLKEKLCTCSNTIKAQVMYALKVEMARTVEDVVDRRLGLTFVPCHTKGCRKLIEQMI